MRTAIILYWSCCVFMASGFWTAAQSADSASPAPSPSPGASSTNLVQELKRLSVEELMQQPVTTVERRASTVGATPAAVSVITQDEIRRSGATTIPEVLRRVPGVDVARINGNIWAVSVRGLNDRFANKLLVQIDGRTVYNPLFAGVYWDAVDYPLEDIDRIEVVRGPGASVWGANAVNGVVNIITKSAKDTEGTLLSAGAGNEELGFGTLRYGAKASSNLLYRVYVHGFNRAEQFSPERDPNDQWWSASTGMRFDWTPNPLNDVMFQGNYLYSSAGQSSLRPKLTPPFVFADLEYEDAQAADLLSRWTHRITEENTWSLQTYWDHVERKSENQISNYRWDTFDLDFNHQFELGDRQLFVYGAGYRYQDVFGGKSDIDNGFIQQFIPPHRHLQLFSAFVQDQLTLIEDKFYLTAGTKVEHNDFTGVEIQPTGRLLWTPTKDQSAWFAVSRAVRTPSLAERNLQISGFPVAPGVIPQVRPNPDFESEELIAYELGYRAQATRTLAFDASLFHNDYDNLSAGLPGAPTLPPPPIIVPLQIVNGASGQTEGAEIGLTWQAVPYWKLYGAYTLYYERIHTDIAGAALPEFARSSPKHQVFAQSSLDLPHDIAFDLLGRWVDRLPGFQSAGTPNYFSLDARLAWSPTKRFELALVGQNLLQDHHQEFGTNPFIQTTLTEIERSIYAKLTWRF